MSKKAIILGGHGFLGSAIAGEAKKRGWETVIVDRAGYQECVGMACDLLINANGNSKKYLPEKDASLDFDLSVRSVSLSLHDFQTKLYVYISSVDVYSEKSNPAYNHEESFIAQEKISCYGFHKLLAEQLVQHHAKSWLILRLGGFVGPGLKKNPIYDLLTKQPLRVHPDSRCQYLATDCMAAIVFQLIEQGLCCSIFNLTGEGIISVREIARLLPGNLLDGAPLEQPPGYYDINISKIKKIAAIPSSWKTVERFVRDVQAGIIKLS